MENDKELNTSVWLKFKTAAEDRDHVATRFGIRCVSTRIFIT